MQQDWWKEAVVYQVYWRSFLDSDGDGYGDLEGVIKKLDYIKYLGIDVIWLNPCYESPDIDNGYDISSYQEIMDKAGTMEVFNRLLEEVHKRDMKLIMDLVVNHTSDQHYWFQESRKSTDNPYRDYYIWKPGRNGREPNNWRSYFTPSTWEYDEKTNEYYFHSFAVEQPDLNWENPAVRREIYQMMRYWLDKGIDGFRMDVINLLAKIPGFPDAEKPEDISYLGNNPGIHDYLQEMHEEVLKDYDIFTVGEIPFVTPEDGLLYVGEDRKELNTLFHFEVLDDMKSWDLLQFKSIQKRWYEGLWKRGWNSQFLNNHDHTRLVTRFGNDKEYRQQSATCFATLIHTLPGIPYVFQGEEIGMTGVRFNSIDEYNDIAMINEYKERVANGEDSNSVFEELVPFSRDNSRTPMQWNDEKNAGFTSGQPWIQVNPNYHEINVKKALDDPDSIFYYYQNLIEMRKRHSVMTYGEYHPILEDHPTIYAYYRVDENEKWFILLNLSEEDTSFSFTENKVFVKQLVIHNYPVKQDSANSIRLRPYEARVYTI
ncbi:oligo-1,4-1,6-alpha-glucosidase [Gracilibacillus halophilus YIM-C55.5]|uniref:oligo-1,6-glucosidase n=1 Tax=Gracilibacillus halophilus YIM-C55.5 TaxID=1308866 RepID=N4WS45_9BACI|nr:alpha-glucosidase [Gracilibacillus halophilus]ENH95996.1 oligo-1,4-1,6-alpha-glucosidase [Gracilibacillus halophilus YIM-C55.5]